MSTNLRNSARHRQLSPRQRELVPTSSRPRSPSPLAARPKLQDPQCLLIGRTVQLVTELSTRIVFQTSTTSRLNYCHRPSFIRRCTVLTRTRPRPPGPHCSAHGETPSRPRTDRRRGARKPFSFHPVVVVCSCSSVYRTRFSNRRFGFTVVSSPTLRTSLARVSYHSGSQWNPESRYATPDDRVCTARARRHADEPMSARQPIRFMVNSDGGQSQSRAMLNRDRHKSTVL